MWFLWTKSLVFIVFCSMYTSWFCKNVYSARPVCCQASGNNKSTWKYSNDKESGLLWPNWLQFKPESVCFWNCMFARLFVCLYVYLYEHLFILYLFVCLFVYDCLFKDVCWFVCFDIVLLFCTCLILQFMRNLEDEINAIKMEEASLKRKLNGK